MATHSSTLAWKIPWTEEPGRLLSMGSQRAGHGWACKYAHMWFSDRVIFLSLGFVLLTHILKKLFILYWHIADQQCCDGFRWTAKGLSHTYIWIHLPQTPLPSLLWHNIEQSSLCYRSLLGIHFKYNNVYMSISNSLSLPFIIFAGIFLMYVCVCVYLCVPVCVCVCVCMCMPQLLCWFLASLETKLNEIDIVRAILRSS